MQYSVPRAGRGHVALLWVLIRVQTGVAGQSSRLLQLSRIATRFGAVCLRLSSEPMRGLLDECAQRMWSCVGCQGMSDIIRCSDA